MCASTGTACVCVCMCVCVYVCMCVCEEALLALCGCLDKLTLGS